MQNLEPLLEKYGVRLYMSGHEHNLQHLHVDGANPHYLISGGGSRSDYDWNTYDNGGGKFFYQGSGAKPIPTPSSPCWKTGMYLRHWRGTMGPSAVMCMYLRHWRGTKAPSAKERNNSSGKERLHIRLRLAHSACLPFWRVYIFADFFAVPWGSF
jgi:hypothetical protein